MKSLHHSFDIDLAAEYGVEEAILIHHFQHWISLNRRTKKNFREGKTWTYQTLQQIADQFPYWDVDKVRVLMDRLILGKSRFSRKEEDFEPVLIKKNFNKTAFDRTCWYAFVDEERFSNNSYERLNDQMEKAKRPNPNGQTTRPIPDTLNTFLKADAKTSPKVSSDPGKKPSSSSSSQLVREAHGCQPPSKKPKETLSPPPSFEEEEEALLRLKKRKNQAGLEDVVDERAWKNVYIKKMRLEKAQQASHRKQREDLDQKETQEKSELESNNESLRKKEESIENEKRKILEDKFERKNKALCEAVGKKEIPYIINREQLGSLLVTMNEFSASFSIRWSDGGSLDYDASFRECWSKTNPHVFECIENSLCRI